MNINYKTLTKAEFPYIDDNDIDTVCGIMYGKNASIPLVCVNPNQDSTNPGTISVYKLPELTSDVGSVYMKVDDVWKATTSYSVDYVSGLISISGCRSDTGQAYEVKLVNCYGYMNGGHSYPRQVIEHFFSNYGGREYNASNFDQATWESELDHADIQADISFIIDDEDLSFWEQVYNISRMSKSYFRVDFNSSGKIYAKRIDLARASSAVISSCELRNANTLVVGSSRDGVYSSVLTKFFYNKTSDTWLSIRNNTYENEVKQSYRKVDELEEETYLVNSSDATERAYKHATMFADIQHPVELEIYEHLDLDLFDVITVALMPDNLSSSARTFAGNKDCLVIATNPKEKERINYVTVQILPDRVPTESQSAVIADTFTTVERPKSSIEIVKDSVVETANIDAYLTNPAIDLSTDETGTVLTYDNAVGSMKVISSGVDVSADAIFGIEYKPDSVTATISELGAYSITASTENSAIVVFYATYGGVKITKTLTIIKRLQGTTVVVDEIIPDDIVTFTAKAYENRIEVLIDWDSVGMKNTLGEFLIEISRDGSVWNTFNSATAKYTYYFDRLVDKFPEISVTSALSPYPLNGWKVRAKAKNIYGKYSANYSPSDIGLSIDTSSYLGWTPVVPSTSTSENGRGPAIGWNEASAWYGKGSHDIQIAKGYTVVDSAPVLITDTGALVAYAPALGLNPKESYDNYKTGAIDGFITREGSTLALSLPLYGQNETESLVFDTPYYIRVRSSTDVPTSANPTARITSAWSAWDLVYARASSAQDLVENAIKSGHVTDNAITANKIYVEMLAAISANLGVITDGAMAGSANNYWALSRVYDTDGITVLYYEGEMRVGGENQYLKVTPVVVNGVVTDYTIDFKVGTFTVTANGSTVNGDFIVKSYDGTQTLMSVDKTTGAVTINTPSITSDSNQVATTEFVKDVARPLSNLSRVMQINGDGVPMFPDNVAGTVCTNRASDWFTNQCTLSMTGSVLSLATTGNDPFISRSVSMSGSANRFIRIVVDAPVASVLMVFYTTSGHGHDGGYQKTVGFISGQNVLDIDMGQLTAGGSDWINNTITNIRLDFGGVSGVTYRIYGIYIGSGLYDTPVYDKACCNRATNYGVLPVKGLRGQALLFNGATSYCVASSPVIGTSGTIAFTFKRNVLGATQNIFTTSNAATNGIFAIFNASNVLRFAFSNGTAIPGYGTNTFADTTSIHSVVIRSNGTVVYDGVVSSDTVPIDWVQGLRNLIIGQNGWGGEYLNAVIYDFRYDSRIWTQDDVTRYHNGDDAVDSQQKAVTAVPHSIVTRDASGNIRDLAIGQGAVASGIDSISLGHDARATGNGSIASGYNASATSVASIANGYNTSASGGHSIASGHNASSTGDASIASGYNASASGVHSISNGNYASASGINAIAIGNYTNTDGDHSVGIGDSANTSRPYEINLNNRIRYLEFASTATQGDVYTALSALMNPTVGTSVGAIGRVGTSSFNEASRPAASQINVSKAGYSVSATFNSGSTTPINGDLQICFVQYADVV